VYIKTDRVSDRRVNVPKNVGIYKRLALDDGQTYAYSAMSTEEATAIERAKTLRPPPHPPE